MDFKGYALVLVVVMAVLGAGCMESVDYQPPKGANVGNGTLNGTSYQNATLSGLGNATNVSNLNLTQIPPVNISSNVTSNTTGLTNETLNEDINGTLVHHDVNFTVVENITGGNAKAGANGTYEFKLNDVATVGGKKVKVEKIWETSVLALIVEERERFNLLETKRIEGLNITLNEIFYDRFAQNRMAYLEIV